MASAKPSALVDTRVIYCGDNLEQLKKLPDAYVDLIYIDPPFNSNRNYEVFWGETKEKRAFEDRHANTEPLHHLNSHALRWAGLRATIAAGNLHNSMLTKFIAAVFCFCSIFALAEEKPVMGTSKNPLCANYSIV